MKPNVKGQMNNFDGKRPPAAESQGRKQLFGPLLVAAFLACLAPGCSTQPFIPRPELGAQPPVVSMSGMKKFYVVHADESGRQDDKHTRSLHAVAQALTDHGFAAGSGLVGAIPSDTDCKVVIEDHWFWDTYWYLLSLDLKVYDARSGKLLASGHERRAPPIMRRTAEFMASDVVEAVFPASLEGSKP
jgi:hypothetical protein